MAALGTCERGRGVRELRKASNDKNTTQHHDQANARVSVPERESAQAKAAARKGKARRLTILVSCKAV